MYLGIDLGTSNSAVVGIDGDGVRLFKTEDGKDVLASMLYFDRRGHMSVGSRAQAQAELAPDQVAQGFKRLMGTSSTIDLAGANKTINPEEASTEIILQLLRQAEAETGAVEIEGAIITIPAAFNQMQSEATIRAAHAAGLGKVGLLQEPVAAAMAALEGAANRDGRFLIYDLGGGTFDVALVEATGGTVNVLAHEGINMLGGRDFDGAIINSVVRPWLAENFDLPTDMAVRPEYRRLLGVARMKAEIAKIELSTRDKTQIYLSDEDTRATDLAGAAIYVEVELTREKLESLILERVEDTIRLCRKILRDNGMTHEDIDRLVFIGGPSKMPVIRDMVSRELGVPADHKTDPMTAVARGAAIFAESREWSGETGQRKASRGSVTAQGSLALKLDFAARSPDEKSRLRLTADTEGTTYRYRVTGPDGFDTGFALFDGQVALNLPLRAAGSHVFRIFVEDQGGTPACDPQTITITRTAATAAAIQATQTISVKVAEGPASERRNVLDSLIKKGTALPVKGLNVYRLRESLVGGTPSHFDVEVFNQAEGVDDPFLNLAVGVFRVNADDVLERGETLPAGAKIEIHWQMDDNGLINCEVAVPDLAVHLNNKSFYVPTQGHERFDGEDGHRLAADKLDEAEASLANTAAALGESAKTDIGSLERRIARQRELLANSNDAEARKAVTEEALHVQQELARMQDAPEHRRSLLLQEIERIEDGVADMIESLDGDTVQRLNTLLYSAREEIRNQNWKKVNDLLRQAQVIFQRALYDQPGFVLAVFESIAQERHAALDKGLHDQLVKEGRIAVDAHDVDGLRDAVARIFANRMPTESASKGVAMLAGLLRH